ncbi:hypothetical protein Q31b_32860 [Novipirellula aureliae]|uniref:Uncharacterized protein n=1 Tax=Novipirellula aureliae TaxID=2527966 RepID=A0A5C6DTC1_9BACT|nr:hypothetical protein [Novipirellula aureliae]TWU39970.1 hypothetical protein Q31b_32860 [Novipirellula aureliae]
MTPLAKNRYLFRSIGGLIPVVGLMPTMLSPLTCQPTPSPWIRSLSLSLGDGEETLTNDATINGNLIEDELEDLPPTDFDQLRHADMDSENQRRHSHPQDQAGRTSNRDDSGLVDVEESVNDSLTDSTDTITSEDSLVDSTEDFQQRARLLGVAAINGVEAGVASFGSVNVDLRRPTGPFVALDQLARYLVHLKDSDVYSQDAIFVSSQSTSSRCT